MPSSQGTGPWEQRTSMPSNLGLTSSRPAIEAVGSARETNTPKAVPAADETAAVTPMAARGLSHTSEDRSIWTVAERRATVSCAMECRGVLAPRSKALQSQTRMAKETKRAAIAGMLHGGVERGQPGAARGALTFAFLLGGGVK